jgi:hypothetical protein
MLVLQLPRVVTAVKKEPLPKSFEPLKDQSYNSTFGYTRTGCAVSYSFNHVV